MGAPRASPRQPETLQARITGTSTIEQQLGNLCGLLHSLNCLCGTKKMSMTSDELQLRRIRSFCSSGPGFWRLTPSMYPLSNQGVRNTETYNVIFQRNQNFCTPRVKPAMKPRNMGLTTKKRSTARGASYPSKPATAWCVPAMMRSIFGQTKTQEHSARCSVTRKTSQVHISAVETA